MLIKTKKSAIYEKQPRVDMIERKIYLFWAVFCDIIFSMKKVTLFFMVALLAGCQSAPVGTYDEYVDNVDCVGNNCEIIHYSMPNGNDLVLETAKHTIQIAAQPDVKYGYYVWAGNKETTEDPDLIVEDGNAMVLVEE